jgi:hypothetical protein
MSNNSGIDPRIFLAIAALAIIFEAIQLIRKFLTFKALRRTGTQGIDEITSKLESEIFECSGRPMATETSPISMEACAWWSFQIIEAKVNTKGNTASVPTYSKYSEPSWIFLETADHILALCALDGEKVEKRPTFSWTSIVSDSMPAKLHNYLNSGMHDTHLQVPEKVLFHSVATTYCEEIVPSNISIHVIGQVRRLNEQEMSQIKGKISQLKVQKKILEYTLSGDNYFIGLNNEAAIIKNIKSQIFFHVFILLFAVVILYLTILQVTQ